MDTTVNGVLVNFFTYFTSRHTFFGRNGRLRHYFL